MLERGALYDRRPCSSERGGCCRVVSKSAIFSCTSASQMSCLRNLLRIIWLQRRFDLAVIRLRLIRHIKQAIIFGSVASHVVGGTIPLAFLSLDIFISARSIFYRSSSRLQSVLSGL
jgi:hypothetical protein